MESSQFFFFFFCNLFIVKETQRQIQIKNIWHAYTILHRQTTFNLQKLTFCNAALKFQTPRTASNGNHFLHIYSFYVGDKKCMVVFSIFIQYFIVLSVLLRYTDSDCPFGIFKLFLYLHLYWVYHPNIYI